MEAIFEWKNSQRGNTGGFVHDARFYLLLRRGFATSLTSLKLTKNLKRCISNNRHSSVNSRDYNFLQKSFQIPWDSFTKLRGSLLCSAYKSQFEDFTNYILRNSDSFVFFFWGVTKCVMLHSITLHLKRENVCHFVVTVLMAMTERLFTTRKIQIKIQLKSYFIYHVCHEDHFEGILIWAWSTCHGLDMIQTFWCNLHNNNKNISFSSLKSIKRRNFTKRWHLSIHRRTTALQLGVFWWNRSAGRQWRRTPTNNWKNGENCCWLQHGKQLR